MKLIILDRDGVINEDSAGYIKSPGEWHPIPGSLEAVARLNRAGYRVVVATNQSGLARGLLDIEALNGIHDRMRRALGRLGGHIDAIFFCPHHPDEGCDCRKPRPGLLLEVGARLHVPLRNVPVVGDALRDVQSARAVGAYPVLVRTGKGEDTLRRQPDELGEVAVFPDLGEMVAELLDE